MLAYQPSFGTLSSRSWYSPYELTKWPIVCFKGIIFYQLIGCKTIPVWPNMQIIKEAKYGTIQKVVILLWISLHYTRTSVWQVKFLLTRIRYHNVMKLSHAFPFYVPAYALHALTLYFCHFLTCMLPYTSMKLSRTFMFHRLPFVTFYAFHVSSVEMNMGSHYVPWYPKVEVRCPEKRHERRAAMKGLLWAQKQKYGPKYGGNHISAIVVSNTKVVFSIPHWWSGFFPSSKASSAVIYIGTWLKKKNKASWSPAKSSEMVRRHA